MNTHEEHIEQCIKCHTTVGVAFSLCQTCHNKRLKHMASLSSTKRQKVLEKQRYDDDTAMNTETMSTESAQYLRKEVLDFKKTLKKLDKL